MQLAWELILLCQSGLPGSSRCTAGRLFLRCLLRLSAPSFAVALGLVLPNLLHVAVGPNASVYAAGPDSAWLINLAREQPPLQSHPIDAHHPCDLRCRVVAHYAIPYSVYVLTCQAWPAIVPAMLKTQTPQSHPSQNQSRGTDGGVESPKPSLISYSIQDAARVLSLNRHVVGELISLGKLPAHRQGRTKQILRSDLLTLIEHDIPRELFKRKPFPKGGFARKPSRSKQRAQKARKDSVDAADHGTVRESEPVAGKSVTRGVHRGPVVSPDHHGGSRTRKPREIRDCEKLVVSQAFRDWVASLPTLRSKRGRPRGKLSQNTPTRIALAAALSYLGCSKRSMRTLLYPHQSDLDTAEDNTRKLFTRHGKEISREQAGMLRDRAVDLLHMAKCHALFPERPKARKS